jgi:hypothetical protein
MWWCRWEQGQVESHRPDDGEIGALAQVPPAPCPGMVARTADQKLRLHAPIHVKERENFMVPACSAVLGPDQGQTCHVRASSELQQHIGSNGYSTLVAPRHR